MQDSVSLDRGPDALAHPPAGANHDGARSPAGANWNYLNLGSDVLSLAVNGSKIFAGTKDNGVYSSTDNGTTWVQTELNNQRVNSLAVNGSGGILAGTSGHGIYMSTNNGTIWVNTGLHSEITYSLTSDNDYIFTGIKNGIHRSSDNGESWESVTSGYYESGILDWNGSNIYKAVNGGFMEPYCNISHSTNNGMNWISDWYAGGPLLAALSVG